MPKYYKDESGFCYAATDALARMPEMAPWDGLVDANGFATDVIPEAQSVASEEPVAASKPRARKAKAAEG